MTHINLMANVFHFQQNAHQALLGTIIMDVPQQATLAQLEPTSMEINVFHINHVIKEEYGMIL